jgi:protein TonB
MFHYKHLKIMKTIQLPVEEIIFENRNKEYGAYFLRKIYPKSLSKAFVISSSLVTLLLVSPIIYRAINPVHFEELTHEIPYILDPPPSINEDVKQVIPPTPPPPQLPKAATIAFTIPDPTPDELVDEKTEPPTQTELEGKVISTVTSDGDGNYADNIMPIEDQKEATVVGLETDKDEPVLVVEQQPNFPGGLDELMKFLGRNLRYPKAAQNNEVEGKVYVQFVVNREGKVSQVTVLKGIGYGCDEEAVRVMNLMPAWTPGKQGGKAVSVRYNLPISFKLQK